ncbi:MAG TPA: NHL repeat-containing protein [Solirubrobacterales bacterium]|nr:NHL repeat-containing protein [Solirubrobacterales bacterium]
MTLSFLIFISAASADITIGQPGEGAGQTKNPQGLATDFETGRLYVADRDNNRVDVFEANGTFVMAFGWGVDTEAAEFQTCTTASGCNAGIAGSGAGQFNHPTSVAVDNDASSASRHSVYVGTENFRVQKFKATGGFVEAFGGQGTGPCQFSRIKDPIAVGPGGEVDVADSYDKDGEGPLEVFVSRIVRFDAAGKCLSEVPLFEGNEAINEFAVDSAGDFYVTVERGGGLVRKYDPSGTPLYRLGSNEGKGSIANEAQGLAVDVSDNLFVKQSGSQLTKSSIDYFFTEYDSSGATVRRFGYFVRVGTEFLTVSGLAAYHGADGDLFASRKPSSSLNEVKYLALSSGPVVMPEACKVKTGALGNIKATLQAEVNPEGKATTVRFQYVDEDHFEAEGFSNPEETAESESIGSDFDMHEASTVADLVPETEYHCRAVATNADAPIGVKGLEGTFTSKPPLEIGTTTVSDVGVEEATLNATVNPLGVPNTTGYFEYVSEATYLKDSTELGPEHGFDHATKVPNIGAGEPPIDFGAGESFVAGSVQVSGLTPSTSYRYRIVASDSKILPKEIAGPAEAFRTFGADAGALPDNRAYELASPAQKNSADVAVPGAGGGIHEPRSSRIQAGASSGEAITYTSWTSFGEAKGAPGAASQYLSKRTASGWETENISPPGLLRNPVVVPYTGFTPDLGFGALRVDEPALTADCPEGFQSLYLRDNARGALRCLTPETPKSGSCFVYAGASEDGSHVFFAAQGSYAGAPEGNGFNLYEWSATRGLEPVSILPGETEAVVPDVETSFGARGVVETAGCQTGQTTLRHVVSADGRIVFWTYGGKYESSNQPLLARIDGGETIQLDAKVGGGKGGEGNFLAASADGSKAFFTAPGKLNSEAKAAGQLYRYDTAERTLNDLTPGAIAPEVLGVVGASDDGSYLYFVAKGALTGAQEGAVDEIATAGKENLYSWHEGEGLRFIALLAPEDVSDWSTQPQDLSAHVSPDGRHLAFLSLEAEALAGYDNRVAAGDHCLWEALNKELSGNPLCPEAFLYDAEAKVLTCVSCNPSGARPLGPTLLPGWTNVYEGPRYLSEDGSKFFFESFDAISAVDENGKRDVYEFERAGKGSCTSESPAFDPAVGGCHFLVSSGKSTDHSYLVDASLDGRDVFLSTRSPLVGWDSNENYDVYDARERGGFPEPVEAPICQGEACLPPSPSPPATSSPFHFEGPLNPVARPRPCKPKPRKPKPSKHGRKSKKHKAKKSRGCANHKRGAGR